MINPYVYVGLPMNILSSKDNYKQAVFSIIEKRLGFSQEQLSSKYRGSDLVACKMLIGYYFKGVFPLKEIGKMLGGKDHSTIIYYQQQVIDLIEAKDKKILESIKIINDELYPLVNN